MIATEAEGDPYVGGLPISWSPLSEGQGQQDNAFSDFRRRIEFLRQLAEKPEPKPATWSIRARRRRCESPRILAYPVKPANELVKAQGAYMYKSPLFTQPMLNMRVPKRRQLGSERRAFDLTKKYMDLKREREKEIRKAQAKVRRRRRAQINSAGDQVVGRAGGVHVEETMRDDKGFLESRLVDYREARKDRAPRHLQAETPNQGQIELDTPGQSVGTEAMLVRTEEQRPTTTIVNDYTAVTQREPGSDDVTGRQDRIKQAQEKHVHAVHPHVMKPKITPTSTMSNASKHTAAAEEPLFPWGQTGMFDEADFLLPGQRSQEEKGEGAARSHGK